MKEASTGGNKAADGGSSLAAGVSAASNVCRPLAEFEGSAAVSDAVGTAAGAAPASDDAPPACEFFVHAVSLLVCRRGSGLGRAATAYGQTGSAYLPVVASRAGFPMQAPAVLVGHRQPNAGSGASLLCSSHRPAPDQSPPPFRHGTRGVKTPPPAQRSPRHDRDMAGARRLPCLLDEVSQRAGFARRVATKKVAEVCLGAAGAAADVGGEMWRRSWRWHIGRSC